MNEQAKFDEWFKGFNTWDLSYDDLIRLMFKGVEDGDVVYVSPGGCEMTLYMCMSWIEQYRAAHSGWMARSKL